jgi:outer membrane protein assembly factor BamB
MMRSRTLRALTAFAVAASPALAAELIVGGPQGITYLGDPVAGGFQFFGTCGGPIQSMAQLGNDLYLGDEFGNVYRENIATGQLEDMFQVTNDAAAMAVHDGQLLIGGSNSTVLRVDPLTRSILATYNTPEPVSAMTLKGDFVYVSGGTSAIYRAEAATGAFSYFTCSCFGTVNALLAVDDSLFLVDQVGSLWQINLNDGFPMAAFWIGTPGETLALLDGEILVGDSDQKVRRFDPSTGTETGSITVPVIVHAMVLRGSAPCAGDFDGSGAVDLGDLTILLNAFAVSSGGDMDGDGKTGLIDLAQLLSQFGSTCD